MERILPEGTLISGPNADGTWSRSAEDYKHTEVALDYNARIPGAIAFMKDLNDETTIKVTSAQRITLPLLTLLLENRYSTVRNLVKPVSWRLVISGDKSGAVKEFTGTGSTVSVKWNGDADQGDLLCMIRSALNCTLTICLYMIQKNNCQSRDNRH